MSRPPDVPDHRSASTDGPPPPGRLVISIVTWRAADLTIDCLHSVAPEMASLPGTRVIVVDNNSGDGSAERIERALLKNRWGEWAVLLRAPSNGGFASGNNLAIREALQQVERPDYVLLLNPDTVVRAGALRKLLEFMQEHPEVGIAGGRSEDPDGTPQSCCFRFHSILSEFATYLQLGLVDRLLARWITRVPTPEAARAIDWVSGAHMMIRRAVLEDVGLMDEGYFLYYEETDFTLAARRAGWTCWHVPESRVVHLVGQSTGLNSRNPAPRRCPAYWFESRRRYFVLNHGWLYAVATDLLVVVATLLQRSKRCVQRRPRHGPPRFLRDFIWNSALLRGRGSLGPRRNAL